MIILGKGLTRPGVSQLRRWSSPLAVLTANANGSFATTKQAQDFGRSALPRPPKIESAGIRASILALMRWVIVRWSQAHRLLGSLQMPENEAIFAFPPSDTQVTQSAQPAVAALREKPPIELDMGEASREEGFRLYGCR